MQPNCSPQPPGPATSGGGAHLGGRDTPPAETEDLNPLPGDQDSCLGGEAPRSLRLVWLPRPLCVSWQLPR